MKFIDGGQLDEVARRKPMSPRNAAELIAKLARAVHCAHEHGILHRDIKPGNILIDTNGEPHLTDFGLARLVEGESTLTRTLDVLGTPSYMAPEQAAGNNAAVSKATDVYGLGAVFYQLLTGQPPFGGGTTYETIKLVLDTEPRQPRLLNTKIDRDLATICLKCLEKDPKRRYSAAAGLAEDLERWLRHQPIRARHTGIFARGRKWVRRNPTTALLVVFSLAFAATVGVMLWKSKSEQSLASNLTAPEKSIAVLPFEHRGEDKANAFFADGVQDEILTDLARIADLKVISRTSVIQYKSRMPRNLREIGRELSVANVVEGSVQRSGNRVRVNAQLVDARTDPHLWAQTYDRDLVDVFAIQSEIAKAIAEQLQAKLSPTERNAIERPSTTDIKAFDLYTRAKDLLLRVTLGGTTGRTNLLQGVDLLNQAVTRDPSFFQAYCLLAKLHDYLYFFGFDHTPGRLAQAEAAVQSAASLRPDAGETHLARAWNLYYGYRNYDGALAELDVARQSLPNDSAVFELMAYIRRRQWRSEDSIRLFNRALDLDPRNFLMLGQLASTYMHLRRYADAKSVFDRVLAIDPNDALTKAARASAELDWKADSRPLHETIDSIRATSPGAIPTIATSWLTCALAERDVAAATDALMAEGENEVYLSLGENLRCSRSFVEGLIARMSQDNAKARSAFTAARAQQEKVVEAQPNYGPAWCVLGLIDAGRGDPRFEKLIEEAKQPVALK
jgi:TolB-like protein/Tfp pilus assembly protein PilF